MLKYRSDMPSLKLFQHRNRVIDTLHQKGHANIAHSIRDCGSRASTSPSGRKLPIRCHRLFCPVCRKIRMDERVKSYRHRFARVPTENLAMVTLLFQPHLDLWTPLDPDALTASDRHKLASGVPAAKIEIDRLKLRYSRVVGRAFDEYVQAGGVEFEEVLATSGPNKRSFVESFSSMTPDASSVLVSHAHFVLAARAGGKWLTREEIAEILRADFDHPYQVRIDPPKKTNLHRLPMSPAEAVTGFIRYSMKGFSDFTPERVVDLARFDDEVTKHFYAFNRSTAMFKLPVREMDRRRPVLPRSDTSKLLNRLRTLHQPLQVTA